MMTQEEKRKHAIALLRYFPEPRALMCSFGKDSMVLLHLIREALPSNPMFVHSYPVHVLFHRHPWFPQKHEFADSIIRSWNLEVHDYPPMTAGIKFKADRLELVARYPFGSGAMDLPINVEEPPKRREFACGLQWLLQPRQNGMTWNWKTVFIGHKSSDVDPFEGQVPLRHDATGIGSVNLVFPLRHWTDDDVWDYIEEHHIPYDKRRYAGRMETPNKWLNPDYIHACCNCIDPRNKEKTVYCPKLNKDVENVSGGVPVFNGKPDYILKEEEYVVSV